MAFYYFRKPVKMSTPEDHIETIRTQKFSIGGEENPLLEDLHYAVKHLSAELYSKDVHFLMELIQNAEDNDYPSNVEASLKFVVTDEDITGVGAPATLLIFNNENGFNCNNIESLCSVGRSTKKGKRKDGYIGEKGIGFKSVFLVSSQPYIFSNGYRIRFNEIPPPDTKIGYIVPEWVHSKPNHEDIRRVYGDGCMQGELPNTVIILPLRPEKVQVVKEQLAIIHPEIILFMTKIKKLSVHEANTKHDNTVSVSQETAFRTVKDNNSESFILHVSAQADNVAQECSYYMWRQKFPVNAEHRVEERMDVEEWIITLAFPREERVGAVHKLASGIYAFLPTETITGLPFIIQADFLLVSSRESIRFDNKWNQGILACIPSAFCCAFLTLVKGVVSAPAFSRTYCFDKFLPLDTPPNSELRFIGDGIQAKLRTEEIILCQHPNEYCTPQKARRILPAFRTILENAREEVTSPLWSTGGVSIVHSCMENLRSLQFLGVEYVPYHWYSLCIQCERNWVENLSQDLYVKLLCFLGEMWLHEEISVHLQHFPLLKYQCEGRFGSLGWASFSYLHYSNDRIYLSRNSQDVEWLVRWSNEVGINCKFMPKETLSEINKLGRLERKKLLEWLRRCPKVAQLSFWDFVMMLIEKAKVSRTKEFIIGVAHFLHFSCANKYIDSRKVETLYSELPAVDHSGKIVSNCTPKLEVDDSGSIANKPRPKFVPPSMGKWAKLTGSHQWVTQAVQGSIVLSEAYTVLPSRVHGMIGKEEHDLNSFLSNGLKAMDIPYLTPPNAALPGLSSSTDEDKAFLLLEWIHRLTVTLRESLPVEFKRSITEQKWLKTSRGFQSPNMAFLLDDKWLSSGLQVSDLSFIDISFYNSSTMGGFKDALKTLGVVVEYGQGCAIVSKHLVMHTDFKAITRLYKHLHGCNWRPVDKESVKIWIPRDGGGQWKDADMCLVRDDNGLFKGSIGILEDYYDDALLPFFAKNLGVQMYPEVEDYWNKWWNWIEGEHQVIDEECTSVFKNILKHWKVSPSTVQRFLEGQELKFPVYCNSGAIQLCARGEAFIPDDLVLYDLFKATRTKFVWHPSPPSSEIPSDSLFSLYRCLGVQNISSAVQKTILPISNDVSLHGLQAGEGLFAKGLYRIVLGYLSYPAFKLSVLQRRGIVRSLLMQSFYETTKPLTVRHTLTVVAEDGTQEEIEAPAIFHVRWEREKQRILIHKCGQQNEKAKLSLATEFAEVISKGLFPNPKDLDIASGLCELLKVGCIFEFHKDVVNYILQHKNLQVLKEDEHFLSQHFRDEDKYLFGTFWTSCE